MLIKNYKVVNLFIIYDFHIRWGGNWWSFGVFACWKLAFYLGMLSISVIDIIHVSPLPSICTEQQAQAVGGFHWYQCFANVGQIF